ncbi:hypothetical protein E2320_008047 [Naja naja]|nr:hypothetical protein E2320_008047 [Naja naja]
MSAENIVYVRCTDSNSNVRKRTNTIVQPDLETAKRIDPGKNSLPSSTLTQGPLDIMPRSPSASSPNPFSRINISETLASARPTPSAPPSTPILTGYIAQQDTMESLSIHHLLGSRLEEIQTTTNALGVHTKSLCLSSPAPSACSSGTSKIDKYARILFPVTFGAFNMVYWVVYLSKDTMEKTKNLM